MGIFERGPFVAPRVVSHLVELLLGQEVANVVLALAHRRDHLCLLRRRRHLARAVARSGVSAQKAGKQAQAAWPTAARASHKDAGVAGVGAAAAGAMAGAAGAHAHRARCSQVPPSITPTAASSSVSRSSRCFTRLP